MNTKIIATATAALALAGAAPAAAQPPSAWLRHDERVAAHYWGTKLGHYCPPRYVRERSADAGLWGLSDRTLAWVSGAGFGRCPSTIYWNDGMHADGRRWRWRSSFLGVCLITVHEYGHVEGRYHSRSRRSIMYPAPTETTNRTVLRACRR